MVEGSGQSVMETVADRSQAIKGTVRRGNAYSSRRGRLALVDQYPSIGGQR